MADVRFEPFGERHLAGVAAMLSDPDLLQFTRVPDPAPPGFEHLWLERFEEGRVDGSREAFAALGEDDAFLGLALAPKVDATAREAELGYAVAPAARGQGIATAMLRELTRWAFEERGMLRVYLLIDVLNPASLQVARRCGYLHEGTLRSSHVKPGAPRADVTVWSRLPTD
jgi:RimJ/RimL family protein N-acetyltransferase